MNNRVMYDQNNRRFERVTRTTAERAYNNGLAVVACPVNLRPFAPWHPEAVLTRQEGKPSPRPSTLAAITTATGKAGATWPFICR